MIAWTGIEHFVAGRFEDPPPADEPDDMQVSCILDELKIIMKNNL
jgi:hypothetical protein